VSEVVAGSGGKQRRKAAATVLTGSSPVGGDSCGQQAIGGRVVVGSSGEGSLSGRMRGWAGLNSRLVWWAQCTAAGLHQWRGLREGR
jgi:hypothetical protein